MAPGHADLGSASGLGARRGTPVRVMIHRVGELHGVPAVGAGRVEAGVWASQGEDDRRAARREGDVEGGLRSGPIRHLQGDLGQPLPLLLINIKVLAGIDTKVHTQPFADENIQYPLKGPHPAKKKKKKESSGEKEKVRVSQGQSGSSRVWLHSFFLLFLFVRISTLGEPQFRDQPKSTNKRHMVLT